VCDVFIFDGLAKGI